MALVALGLTALGLAGCSGQGTGLIPRFGLYFNQDSQGADLAYGEANSDNVGVMLQCAKGSRTVELTDVARSGLRGPLVLVSGSQQVSVPAQLLVDDTGEAVAKATLPLDAPVLQGFRRSGAIAVSLGGLRYGLKARRAEEAAVSSFFTACERS
jgi:hypothetical protein